MAADKDGAVRVKNSKIDTQRFRNWLRRSN
jgi:hypothetical protein